jgi:hypothetical protein
MATDQDINDWIVRGVDQTALEREASHVDRETLDHLRSVILEQRERPESMIDCAHRLAPRLSDEELAQLVADWLEAQTTI